MSDLLATVRDSWQQALSAIQDVSAKAPGSCTTQTLVMGALLGFVTYKLLKKRYRHPPGPWALPLLGNILSMGSKEEAFYVTLKRWADEKYGPIITIHLGTVRCVTLNTIDVITEALVQKANDFAGRPFLYSWHVVTEESRDIAFATYSPAWKLQRKIGMQAVRHYMRGPHFDKAVHEVISMVVEKMAAERGPFDPRNYTSTLMIDLLHNLCFGEPKPFDDPDIKRILYLLHGISEVMGNGFFEDVLPLLKYWPTSRFRKFYDLNFELIDYIGKRIEEHRNTFSPNAIRDITDSILLAQSEAAREESEKVMAMFTDTHVRQTIADIFAAGVDTSRMTLDWMLLYMAGHPEIQKRVQKEIDEATGIRMPVVADRLQLQYTEAVLYEVMRMGTVAPTALPHETLCDTTVGGYDVPKGTMVLINTWAAMHDPDTWDQPEEFRPERFLDDQGKLKPKMENWIPFSTGRRVCMGELVARSELLLLTACLLKRVTISLPEGTAYDPSYEVLSMSLHRPKAYKIVVTPR